MIVVKLDLSDLYHRVNRKFGRKLNFEAVLRHLAGDRVTAYGIQKESEASGFISCLQRLGISTKFKRPEVIKCGDREIKRANWDLEIGIDAVEDIADYSQITEFILGSGSNSMAPLVRYIRRQNMACRVFGCGIGRELRTAATNIIEVTEEILE